MADQLLIRIDPDLKKNLKRLSRAEGKTSSRIVRELVSKYVKERDIASYIDGLWNRIGKKLNSRGSRQSEVNSAIARVRKDRR